MLDDKSGFSRPCTRLAHEDHTHSPVWAKVRLSGKEFKDPSGKCNAVGILRRAISSLD